MIILRTWEYLNYVLEHTKVSRNYMLCFITPSWILLHYAGVINTCRFVMDGEGKTEASSEQKRDTSLDFSDQEEELARNALAEFEGCRYDICLHFLSKLEDLRPKDKKVLHNKAVAEFYKSGCTKTEEFLKALQAIKKKVSYKRQECVPRSCVCNCAHRQYYALAIVLGPVQLYETQIAYPADKS